MRSLKRIGWLTLLNITNSTFIRKAENQQIVSVLMNASQSRAGTIIDQNWGYINWDNDLSYMKETYQH